ncbi:hypothetical protein UMM65_06360 [Aureibaculum sp. 2210JD6-5]|uniref:DUF6973 domain-containing protein n=1 Tax=Aureibaculum sp. 2210JD6-5 TaxID=3103957 RepID=UPI002AAD3E5C|nr:hypothetical protein [Aureibaculum sp. 2210JD6-5]MDY7394857.1 hypothetical protein [Aureibaculum sp. 2210JD6-5]
MKYLLLIVLIFVSSCSPKLKQSYSKLSKPERTWVVFHPFKAKKAYQVSREALITTDSIAKENVIGKDINGGQLDAFKHSFWMARSAQKIGKNASLSLGKAHEKGNYQTYKKRQLEDGILPDKPSSDMDLFNNQIGATLGKKYKNSSKENIVKYLLDAIRKGKLRILKKDSNGNFLNCQGQIIPVEDLKGKWENDKCLIPTN